MKRLPHENLWKRTLPLPLPRLSLHPPIPYSPTQIEIIVDSQILKIRVGFPHEILYTCFKQTVGQTDRSRSFPHSFSSSLNAVHDRLVDTSLSILYPLSPFTLPEKIELPFRGSTAAGRNPSGSPLHRLASRVSAIRRDPHRQVRHPSAI